MPTRYLLPLLFTLLVVALFIEMGRWSRGDDSGPPGSSWDRRHRRLLLILLGLALLNLLAFFIFLFLPA